MVAGDRLLCNGSLCYGPACRASSIALQHVDKHGNSKVRKRTTLCRLTGRRCVKVIITDKAVFDVKPEGLMLREALPGLTISDVRGITEADFEVSPDFIPMRLN